MGGLVRVNELGLAIPPQRLDCLGDDCPVAEKIGRCFVDEHHLYFPWKKFQTDELSHDFQNHDFNRVRLPRCQHHSTKPSAIHSQYSGTPRPRPEIMERFLEEATLLKQLGIISVRSDGLLAATTDEFAPESKIKRREDEWFAIQDTYEDLLQRAKAECEITMPFLQRRSEVLPAAIGAVLLETV